MSCLCSLVALISLVSVEYKENTFCFAYQQCMAFLWSSKTVVKLQYHMSLYVMLMYITLMYGLFTIICPYESYKCTVRQTGFAMQLA